MACTVFVLAAWSAGSAAASESPAPARGAVATPAAGAHPTRASQDQEAGSRIYARSCSVCHGDDGAGAVWARESLRPPPRNFRTPAARAELTRARIYAAVMGGRPGTAMMSFATQLSPAEVAAVATHIEARFLGRTPELAATARLPGTGYPAGLRGDAAWGRRFYEANCATCHGARGDGAGPRAYFISPPPRNFLDAASARLDRAALYEAIANGRNGTEMPAWRQVLSPQEIASVSEYVFVQFLARPEAAVR